MIHSEQSILKILNSRYDHKYQLNNCFIFGWESDYFGFAQSGDCYEIEVKISRADFKNDAKHKQQKFKCFKNADKEAISIPQILGYDWEYFNEINPNGIEIRSQRKIDKNYNELRWKRIIIPNRFYYAVPENMIKESDVPDYAGLIYIRDYDCITVKEARFLHKKQMLSQLAVTLLEKYYYKNQSLRIENRDLKSSLNTKQYYQDISIEKEEFVQNKLNF